MEHNTGNKAVSQFIVMDLLAKNSMLDKVTVKFCNIVITGSHNCPNKDSCIKCTKAKSSA